MKTRGIVVLALALVACTDPVTSHVQQVVVQNGQSRLVTLDAIEIQHLRAQGATVADNTSVWLAEWNLDRIDQRVLPLDSSSYRPDGATGKGVTVYVVDTGILSEHPEFAGRASGDSDCNGHGTHVAGIVAGENVGVARDAKVVAVRVIGCSGTGTMYDVIRGLEWVLANATLPAVVNMSLAGLGNDALDATVRQVVKAGIPVVVAAANLGTDACDFSPAREPLAITVAATDSSDTRPYWSNFGPCVDLFAPGTLVRSAWHQMYARLSGTSMAAPHVAGAVALLLEQGRSPQEVIDNATRDVVKEASSRSNKLLYVEPFVFRLPVPAPQLTSLETAPRCHALSVSWSHSWDSVSFRVRYGASDTITADRSIVFTLSGAPTLSVWAVTTGSRVSEEATVHVPPVRLRVKQQNCVPL